MVTLIWFRCSIHWGYRTSQSCSFKYLYSQQGTSEHIVNHSWFQLSWKVSLLQVLWLDTPSRASLASSSNGSITFWTLPMNFNPSDESSESHGTLLKYYRILFSSRGDSDSMHLFRISHWCPNIGDISIAAGTNDRLNILLVGSTKCMVSDALSKN